LQSVARSPRRPSLNANVEVPSTKHTKSSVPSVALPAISLLDKAAAPAVILLVNLAALRIVFLVTPSHFVAGSETIPISFGDVREVAGPS
jgi:hypothetical protein